MASTLPSVLSKRVHIPSNSLSTCQHQVRHASLLKRPHRPYTFTQLVTLSDGSTYTHRTTSPMPVYRSTKDSRNNLLWQPTMDSLKNIEQDEAGKLRAFRERYGRGFDLEDSGDDVKVKAEEAGGDRSTKESKVVGGWADDDSLMDLIQNAANKEKK